MRRFLTFIILLAAAVAAGACSAAAQYLERVSPEEAGLDSRRLKSADAAIERAIAAGDTPGAVLAVVRHGRIAYLKAYGNRRLLPSREAMTTETIFDMASCSKPVSTAICAMMLVERGEIRLLDPVADYVPGFANWRGTDGKSRTIRIIDLMTHTSGLPAYVSTSKLEHDYGKASPEALRKFICSCRREFAPQSAFRYSCLNYITLQYIIEKVSGESLRDFARKNLFAPLGMNHTDYIPCRADAGGRWTTSSAPCWASAEPDWQKITAPTEKLKDGQILCGVAQDPLARVNGGVSGNAGLFTTAEDLAVLCAMLLNGGEHDGTRILSPLTVRTMTTIPRATSNIGRTPGWDIFTAYSSVNGDLFSPSTYGHTGHTGTSVVIDPENDVAVILLMNSVHPAEGKSVVRLRSLVSNAVAASIIGD